MRPHVLAPLVFLAALTSSDASAQLPFPIRAQTFEIDFPQCGTTTVPVEIVLPYGGPVTFSATALPGAQVTFDPPSVTVPKANSVARTTMTLTLGFLGNAAPPDQAMTVTAGAGTQQYRVRRRPVTILNISPTNVQTPRFGRPGTEVTIQGSGFCNTTFVEVSGRQVTPVRALAMGTQLTFNVPVWADDGPVKVRTFPEGNQLTLPLMVDSMRNVNGFAWANTRQFKDALGDWNINDMIGDFGANPFDPATWSLLALADIVLGDANCFGFSTIGGRMMTGRASPASFPAWDGLTDMATPLTTNARDTWHIWGPILEAGGQRAHDASIAKQIHNAQLMQLSTEVLTSFLSSSNFNGDKSNFHDSVARNVNAGRPALISLGGGCKHAVLAYNLRDQPDGSFNVDIIDPNVPYRKGEKGELHHLARVQETTLSVSASAIGNFDYDDQRDTTEPHVKCSGSLSDVRVLSMDSIPIHGTLPSADILSFLTHFALGAEVAQVSDASGHTLLNADGSTNTDPAKRLPNAMRFFPATGRRDTRPLFFMKGGSGYTYTLRGTAATSVPMWHVGPGFIAHVESYPMTVGAVETVVVDHATSSIELRGSSTKPIVVRLIVRTPGGTKTARVRTTLAAGSVARFEFDAAKETLLYKHGGPAANVSFDLGFQAGSTPEVKTTTSSILIGLNETLHVKPTWAKLEAGAGHLVHKNVKGVETQRPLK